MQALPTSQWGSTLSIVPSAVSDLAVGKTTISATIIKLRVKTTVQATITKLLVVEKNSPVCYCVAKLGMLARLLRCEVCKMNIPHRVMTPDDPLKSMSRTLDCGTSKLDHSSDMCSSGSMGSHSHSYPDVSTPISLSVSQF
ncbi:hypothetical protein ElyMa_004158700 [Elysia marginata]|uniref:Uncharacterized protein n=1 Tax=Elysia marginata TaxID=1093978 RepID=A0AAV4GH24_9GAST|nr:hypothetical protein ElyMa_004158700 [Elysia marginata]